MGLNGLKLSSTLGFGLILCLMTNFGLDLRTGLGLGTNFGLDLRTGLGLGTDFGLDLRTDFGLILGL